MPILYEFELRSQLPDYGKTAKYLTKLVEMPVGVPPNVIVPKDEVVLLILLF